MDMPAKRYSVVLYRFRRISSIKRIKPFVLRGIMIYAKLRLVLLTIWGLTGINSIIFSAYEDMILLVCGLYGVRLLANELQKSKEDQVQKGRENPFLSSFSLPYDVISTILQRMLCPKIHRQPASRHILRTPKTKLW